MVCPCLAKSFQQKERLDDKEDRSRAIHPDAGHGAIFQYHSAFLEQALRFLQNYLDAALSVHRQTSTDYQIATRDTFSIDKSWFSNESQPARPPAVDQTSSERTRIEAALAQSNGKVSGTHGAAARLAMPPSTLESRIRSLKINKFQFKGV